MTDYRYAYLIGELVFVVVWLVLFALNRGLRRKMLVMSLALAPCGPLAELFHARDYWQPLYAWQFWGIGIEDVLGGFLIGGITSVTYDVAFVKRKMNGPRERLSTLMFMLVGGWGAMAVLTLGLKVNSIYASALISFSMGVWTVARRSDLLKSAVLNAILVTALVFATYRIACIFYPRVFEIGWMLENLSRVFIGGVPAEEILWAFAWGFVAGPIYDLFAGARHITRGAAGSTEAAAAVVAPSATSLSS